ncbi:MAG: hypothetical protein ACTSU2_02325 [Promethearchaeota archaeon]
MRLKENVSFLDKYKKDTLDNLGWKWVSGFDYNQYISGQNILSSGDEYLDELIEGGFINGPVYLLTGGTHEDHKYIDRVLMKTAVNALLPTGVGGFGCDNVLYVDGNNSFSPYFIAEFSKIKKLSPRAVFEHILIARAFNHSQMIEIVGEKLEKKRDIGAVFIAGLTAHLKRETNGNLIRNREEVDRFKYIHSTIHRRHAAQNNNQIPPKSRYFNRSSEKTTTLIDKLNNSIKGQNEHFSHYDLEAIESLKVAINGIKRLIERNNNPIVVISLPLHDASAHKPFGGKLISHFGGIIINIQNHERFTEYILEQHPFLPEKRLLKWKHANQSLTTSSRRSGRIIGIMNLKDYIDKISLLNTQNRNKKYQNKNNETYSARADQDYNAVSSEIKNKINSSHAPDVTRSVRDVVIDKPKSAKHNQYTDLINFINKHLKKNEEENILDG